MLLVIIVFDEDAAEFPDEFVEELGSLSEEFDSQDDFEAVPEEAGSERCRAVGPELPRASIQGLPLSPTVACFAGQS